MKKGDRVIVMYDSVPNDGYCFGRIIDIRRERQFWGIMRDVYCVRVDSNHHVPHWAKDTDYLETSNKNRIAVFEKNDI